MTDYTEHADFRQLVASALELSKVESPKNDKLKSLMRAFFANQTEHDKKAQKLIHDQLKDFEYAISVLRVNCFTKDITKF
jgi:hypothetical protein